MIATIPMQVETHGNGKGEPSLTDLAHKIDLLTQQVAYLTAQARQAEQAQQERAELVSDLMPISRDALQMATAELQEVQAYIQPRDLIHLLKNLARHLPQFEMLLDQLDSLTDLLDVASPITKEGFQTLTTVFGELERKGYMTFAQGGMQMMDNIVTSFTADDVKKLGDNVVLILNVVKDMTQPEIMNFIRSTLLVAEKQVEKPVDTSLLALAKQMRDPNVRRGLALTMRVLSVVGAQAEPSKN